MHHFTRAYEENRLVFPGAAASLGTPEGFHRLKQQIWAKQWVVDTGDPVARPTQVLDYVGRYTHRVAICNDRILRLKNGTVTIACKDRRHGCNRRVTMDAVEFIRRFLLHVLPKGFMRVRHYGFLANRCKGALVRVCRRLLGLVKDLPAIMAKSVQALMLRLTGTDITCCPDCARGKMRKVMIIPKGMARPIRFV